MKKPGMNSRAKPVNKNVKYLQRMLRKKDYGPIKRHSD